MPIYAIGFSQLQGADRSRYLDVLRRFSSNSGGEYFEARTTQFQQAYEEIRRAIERVWVVEFECPACRADGAVRRLQLSLAGGGRVLSEGREVRLLPQTRASRSTAAEPDAADSGDGQAETDSATGPAEQRALGGGMPGWVLPVAVVLALASLTLFVLSRRKPAPAPVETPPAEPAPASGPVAVPRPIAKKATSSQGIRHSQPVSAYSSTEVPLSGVKTVLQSEEVVGGVTAKSPLRTASTQLRAEGVKPALKPPPARQGPDPERPEKWRRLKLVVVRGSERGKQYRFMVKDRAIIGKREDCDCVLFDEPEVADQQFELLQRYGQIVIRNINEKNQTLVNGMPIAGRQDLQSGDLIGTSKMILRLEVDR